MAEQSTRIQGAFGAERVPVPNTPLGVEGAGATPAVQDGAPVPFNDAALADQPRIAESRAAREARALKPDSTILEGIGAAVASWDTTRLVQRLTRPEFEDDTPINVAESLEYIDLNLTEDERDYYLDTAVGVKSADYALQQIKDRRMAAEVVGDHPIAGIATSFLDPLWLAVPPSVRIGKAAPVAGRVVSGVAGAGVAGAVTAAGEGPVSDQEIALSMLMNGAASAALYRGGKLVQADPEFPKQALTEAVQQVKEHKPRYKLVSPEVWEDVQIPAKEARFKWVEVPAQAASLPSGINGAVRHGIYPVQFSNPLDRVAYEITSQTKGDYTAVVKQGDRNKALIRWAESAGVTAEQLRERGTAIREMLKVPGASTRHVRGDGKVRMEGEVRTVPDDFFKVNPTITAAKPKMRRVLDTPAEAARVERRKVKEAVYEELPQELNPGYINTDRPAVAAAVEKAVESDNKARGLGDALQWNIHKTMASYGEVGNKVANLLYDNNSDLSITSIESIREANLSVLRSAQFQYEDLLRKRLKDEGYGWLSMANPLTSRKAYAKQLEIEKAVQREMARRELAASGVRVPADAIDPAIKAMADKLDEVARQSRELMQKSGVEGAENLVNRPGYLSRRWSSKAIDDVLDKLEAAGLTREKAHSKVVDLVAQGLRRANDMDSKLARQVGQAIVDRALNKGYFEDMAQGIPGSAGLLKGMRDVLTEAGLPKPDIERALNVLRLETNDMGKASFLKHRMDIDYRASMQIGNERISVLDLIDGRVGTNTDQYVQQVSTQAALAQKGLRTRADVDALRSELLRSISDPAKRSEAAELFDNTMNHFRGLPAGAKVNEAFRTLGAFTRSISLAWSGLWQATEYANAMAEYGLLKTLKYGIQELPGFRKVMKPDAAGASQLNELLAEHSTQSMRLRPYLARYEDGYEMGMGSAVQLSLQTIGQSVPYANAMRYVHHHQARLVGNLILDRLKLAANGNEKAREALAKFGLEGHVMEKLKPEIAKHGFNVDAWDDAVWHATRPAFAKMMDTAVLKGRLGDVPAFAAFDSVGKFLFTYRTFVLTAHNKLLAGGLERDGLGAVGLIMMYQFPLALAAVQAQSVIKGDGVLSDKELVKKGIGQMGGLGLLSEPFKWATGESNSIGAPGLIAVDRGVRMFQGITQGDANKAGTAALSLVPVANVNPIFNAMVNRMKD